MLSQIYQGPTGLPASMRIHLLYSARLPAVSANSNDTTSSSGLTNEQLDQILFLPRIRKIIQAQRKEQQGQPQDSPSQRRPPLDLRLHLTNLGSSLGKDRASGREVTGLSDEIDMVVYNHRITLGDLKEIVDDGADADMRAGTVCYICGPPRMTDEFVGALQGMIENTEDTEKRVFFEKWW